MADEFHGSWWDSSRNRFEGGTRPAASITMWPADMVDMNSRSSLGNVTAAVAGGGSLVLHGGDQSSTGGGDGVLTNQMVCLSMDWNQALFRGDKDDISFRSMLEQDMSSSNTGNFQHVRDFKPQYSQAGSNDSTPVTNFQGMNSASGGYHEDQPMINYPIYSSSIGYGADVFLKQPALGNGSHLHFANTNNNNNNNNTHFWNASDPPAGIADAGSSFFPADQIPGVPSFDGKPNNTSSKVSDSKTTTTKKNNMEQTSNKRPRSGTPSPLPAFKVRKERMGDRITALQQLVSPFGKTDTASVLSESIEYIKFLHEQINALSSPYMKNRAPMQNQLQNSDKYAKLETEGSRQDLRSRGLCLVPVSCTFPMAHETTVDFWTPTYGASFR